MIVFFTVATVLLLAALALVAYPLLRGRAGGPEDRRADVIALARERLEELKQKNQGGEISDEEYAEQVRDVEAQVADDLHLEGAGPASGEAPGAGPATRGGQWIGFAVLAFIPVLTGLLYLTLGTPQALTGDNTSAVVNPADREHPEEVAAMVDGLAARLEANPDDPDGWFMLGRSYMELQRYSQAAGAFRRLRGLVGDVPEVLVREATALALERGGSLAGEPVRLVERALSQQSDHPRAMWLAATAAYQASDFATALDYFRRVEPMLEGEPRQQVRGMIEELTAADGGGQPSAEASTPSAPAEEPAPAEAATASLRVNVDLDPSLRSDTSGQQTVFIFARAVNGPPMPLAVVRKTVADLPVTVTLDESQAMMPQLTLATFDQVTVGARISRSGQPTAQPGDLEGESDPVPTDSEQTVQITIDRVVPEAQ